MPDPREITDVAIDCALHQLPEPQNGWRNHIPPENLGAMVDAGSGQITLQALIAALHYGHEMRPQVIQTLTNYAELCPRRFMLSEPWSWIYGQAIVSCWAAVVVIAERQGNHDLATQFRALLARWAGTCALMEVGGKVLAAGCRGWGHEVHGGGWDDLWAVAARRRNPPAPGSRKYGTPGAYDDWGWLARASYLAALELRAIAAPYIGRDWRSLLPSVPRWGARTGMQLFGWEDGSRLWAMHDDPNGNTPGLILAGFLGGRVIAFPKWPDPATGTTRLRQTKCHASLDGDPAHGWTLTHSHLGEKKTAAGFISTLPPYTASPLAFWVECPAGETTWKIHHPTADLPPSPPAPVPNPGPIAPAPETPRPRRRWWEFWK